MGRALQVITGFVTAPGATLTAWTLASGDSLSIRSAAIESPIHLLQAWADNQVAGTLRVRSPRLHDNVQGIRLDVTASDVSPLLPTGIMQRLFAQDTLVAEQSGSGVAGDIETGAVLVMYDNLPGVDGRLASWEQVKPLIKHILTVENTLALGIAGGYSGEEAIDAEFDLLKANTDYALLGYLVDVECAVVGWRGIDTGNLRVGGPGNETLRHITSEWFIRLNRLTGLPTIPVFNSANKSGILIDGAQDENGTDVTVTTILAELGPTPAAQFTAPGR